MHRVVVACVLAFATVGPAAALDDRPSLRGSLALTLSDPVAGDFASIDYTVAYEHEPVPSRLSFDWGDGSPALIVPVPPSPESTSGRVAGNVTHRYPAGVARRYGVTLSADGHRVAKLVVVVTKLAPLPPL